MAGNGAVEHVTMTVARFQKVMARERDRGARWLLAHRLGFASFDAAKAFVDAAREAGFQPPAAPESKPDTP